MKLAVAVTGFETKEQQVTEENAVLNFKPRFVAVAETNAWNYQAVSFTENKLGEFINETYDGEVTLETIDKHGGKYFAWIAQDGRKAYALVRGSLIFFGNDESAIEKCLAVTRGEADSIAKNPKITELPAESLASGYVSTDGVAQIANIVGLKFASETSEDSGVQSAIAGIVPQLLRNSVTEVSWTTIRIEQGIEDKYSVSITPENASVLKETLVPAARNVSKKTIAFIPPDALSVTRYNLHNPQIAWRSLLLIAGRNFDAINAKILNVFSESSFESHGIADPEKFLGAVDSEIWTVNFDSEGGQSAVVVSFETDTAAETLKKSVTEIDFARDFENVPGAASWTSDDKETRFSFTGALGHRVLILGDSETVQKCTDANFSYLYKEGSPQYRGFYDKFAENNDAIAVTYGKDSTGKTIEVLGELKAENTRVLTNFTTETRFTKTGIERRTFSDFGLIGSIIAQLGKE